jgi:putative FmdB family regulatory protein
MPIYEYACKNCDHTLDALQKMNEEPLVFCPSCGEAGLKKLISAPRFRLKGEGWYETDFKKDKQRNLSKSDGEPAKSDAEQTKSEKSDTKSTTDDSAKGDKKANSTSEVKKSSDKKSGGEVDST